MDTDAPVYAKKLREEAAQGKGSAAGIGLAGGYVRRQKEKHE
jgi:hypothetical protein